MGTTEIVRTAFEDIKTLLVGGERYSKALQGVFSMEKTYRSYRRLLAKADEVEKKQLLSKLHRENAEVICDICRKNGATWVKFAQFLSCRPDLLPPEYIEALQQLQSAAEPVLFSELKHILDEDWGEAWENQFSEFNIIPTATASVAQVHKARLNTGEYVAVKIQIPNVEKRFRQDAVLFRSLAALFAPLVKELDLKQVAEQLITMTLEELNFEAEANNTKKFAQLNHIDAISVPRIYEPISTNRIIVTQWCDGLPLAEYLEAYPHNAKNVLGHMLDSYMQQVMEFGVYHADPHPGNFIVDDCQNLTILDYGALATLSEAERANYAELLMGLLGHVGIDSVGSLFQQAGFSGADQQALEELSQYIQKDRKYQLSLSDSLIDIIDRLRQNRIVMPDSFISMARVLITVGGFMKEYDVTFRWAMEP